MASYPSGSKRRQRGWSAEPDEAESAPRKGRPLMLLQPQRSDLFGLAIQVASVPSTLLTVIGFFKSKARIPQSKGAPPRLAQHVWHVRHTSLHSITSGQVSMARRQACKTDLKCNQLLLQGSCGSRWSPSGAAASTGRRATAPMTTWTCPRTTNCCCARPPSGPAPPAPASAPGSDAPGPPPLRRLWRTAWLAVVAGRHSCGPCPRCVAIFGSSKTWAVHVPCCTSEKQW